MNRWINKVICGDCVEVMKDLPSNSIDLTVTSPPYDNLRDYKGYTFDFESIANQLYRVTKEGGVVVWIVGDATVKGSETGTSFRQALYFKDIGFRLHDTMIYMKNSSPYPSRVRYYQCFEYMFILSKGRPRTVNLIRDKKNRWPSSWGNRTFRQKDGTLRKGGKVYTQKYGTRYNVWKIDTGFGFSTKDKIAYKHPAIFPEQLARDHILSWSNEGDIVLDPMCGSGTTLKVAMLLGRQYIGIDISQEYCDLARKRVKLVSPLLY